MKIPTVRSLPLELKLIDYCLKWNMQTNMLTQSYVYNDELDFHF